MEPSFIYSPWGGYLMAPYSRPLTPSERIAAKELDLELRDAFWWAATPQGSEYWGEVSKNLASLASPPFGPNEAISMVKDVLCAHTDRIGTECSGGFENGCGLVADLEKVIITIKQRIAESQGGA